MTVGDHQRCCGRRDLVGALGELIEWQKEVVSQPYQLVLPRLTDVDQIDRFAALPHLL